MKKLLCIISALFTLHASSQIAVTYSASQAVSQEALNIPLGNSLFYVYQSQGLTFQKNNLNGQPVLIKKFPNAAITVKHLLSKNGLLYVIGTSATGGPSSANIPALFVVDTMNFTLQLSTSYNLTFPNIAWVDINDAKFLNSNNIIMAGSIHSYSVNNTVAWAMEINPTANGMVINTNTLTVGTSTANAFHSFTEISNSSIIFSGSYANPYGFLAKATRSAGNLTFNSLYQTSVGGGILNSFSNPKKIIINNYLNNGSDAIIKLDTNLALLSTISQNGIIRIGSNFFTPHRIKVANNMLYRVEGKVLDILDTGLISVATRSYNVINPMSFNNINITNSNVYMLGYTMYDVLGLVKTDLQGNLSCSNAIPYTNSIFQTNGGQTTFNANTILTSQNSAAPISQSATIVYTVTCGSITSLNDNLIKNNHVISYLDGDCFVKSNSSIQSTELYDVTGKLIKQLHYLNNEQEIKINLKDITSGIYLLKVIGTDKAESIYKTLVH